MRVKTQIIIKVYSNFSQKYLQRWLNGAMCHALICYAREV